MIHTRRLNIGPLTVEHNEFIFELVNSPGWIRFIGNRNVASPDEAVLYILKMLENSTVKYWVAELNNKSEPVGVITIIKRDYLDAQDIGFAFLPEHGGKGYAYEAALGVLEFLMPDYAYPVLLATTLAYNKNSIALLQKLGLRFEKEIEPGTEKLQLFSISVSELRALLQGQRS